MAAPILRNTLLSFLAALAALVAGCVRMPSTEVTPLKPATSAELRQYLLGHTADVERFRARGPFEVTTREDIDVTPPGAKPVAADLYLSSSAGKAPLVILLHGYDNTKSDHAYQAYHLASWGMHTLAVQLPNHGPWLDNGRTLEKIVALVRARPERLDARVDPDAIVLAGHSFGASSVAIALAEGTPALGAVLLDPAAIGRGLPAFLGKIARPVVILGADPAVSVARGRTTFYRYLRGGVAEVSVRGAAHEDAQFPLEPDPVSFGDASGPTEEHQITFVAALTAAAFSLASTGRLDYAWSSLADAGRNARFTDPKRK